MHKKNQKRWEMLSVFFFLIFMKPLQSISFATCKTFESVCVPSVKISRQHLFGCDFSAFKDVPPSTFENGNLVRWWPQWYTLKDNYITYCLLRRDCHCSYWVPQTNYTLVLFFSCSGHGLVWNSDGRLTLRKNTSQQCFLRKYSNKKVLLACWFSLKQTNKKTSYSHWC